MTRGEYHRALRCPSPREVAVLVRLRAVVLVWILLVAAVLAPVVLVLLPAVPGHLRRYRARLR